MYIILLVVSAVLLEHFHQGTYKKALYTIYNTKAVSTTPVDQPLFHTFRENIIILFNYCT